MINIRPVSDLRNKYPEIEEEVLTTGSPVFLTKNGYGSMVVMSLAQYSALTDGIEKGGMELDETLAALSTVTEITQLAEEIRDQLLPKMAELRAVADEAEVLTAKEFWPFPTYGEILF